jgi:hypothetical protein
MRRLSDAVLLLCVAASTVAAQGRPTVLELPAGTRALALGDVFVAGRGSEVIFYNPALLALVPGLTASAQRYGAASTVGAVSNAFAVAGGAAGVGVQMLDFGDGAAGVRGQLSDLTTRGPVAASSLAAAVSIAAPPIKSIRVGVAAKYVEERIGTSRDGGAAFDVGAARDFFGRTTLALSAQNLGAPLHIDGARVSLPTRLTLGAAAFAPPLTFLDLNATAAVTYRRDGAWIPAGGVEVSYVPLEGWAFTGRVGARRVVDNFGAKPMTFGAGISFDRLSLDYAYHALDGPESTHRAGLRIR